MNGIVLVNKAKDMTSFDCVRDIRRKYKVKAGHTGTLDPQATGLLIIAINKATKALNFIEAEDKVYEAKCQLGLKTDTGDIWGETIETKAIKNFTKEELLQALNTYTGKQRQRVPMVSAKKIDGKKLYEYHREGIEIETQYTDIEVYSIELLDYDENTISLKAHVSNGTYIRTLIEDIAEALGNLGTMSALNRSEIGRFKQEDAIDITDLPDELKFIPTKDAIVLPKIEMHEIKDKIKNGHKLFLDTEADQVLVDAGEYFAVYERMENNLFRSVRGLW